MAPPESFCLPLLLHISIDWSYSLHFFSTSFASTPCCSSTCHSLLFEVFRVSAQKRYVWNVRQGKRMKAWGRFAAVAGSGWNDEWRHSLQIANRCFSLTSLCIESLHCNTAISFLLKIASASQAFYIGKMGDGDRGGMGWGGVMVVMYKYTGSSAAWLLLTTKTWTDFVPFEHLAFSLAAIRSNAFRLFIQSRCLAPAQCTHGNLLSLSKPDEQGEAHCTLHISHLIVIKDWQTTQQSATRQRKGRAEHVSSHVRLIRLTWRWQGVESSVCLSEIVSSIIFREIFSIFFEIYC